MELETSRLRVRPFHPGDLEALAEILGDGRVMTFIEPPYTAADPGLSDLGGAGGETAGVCR